MMMLPTKPDQFCGMGEEKFNALSYEEKREVRMARNDAYMVRDRVPDLFWRITQTAGSRAFFLSPCVRVQRSIGLAPTAKGQGGFIAQEVQKKKGDTQCHPKQRARLCWWPIRLPHTKSAPASVMCVQRSARRSVQSNARRGPPSYARRRKTAGEAHA